jgi:fucose permease
MNKISIAVGFLILLIGAFFDNVRGPLIPEFASTLKLGYSDVSWLLIVGGISAVLCTWNLITLLQRYGERKTTIAVGFIAILTIGFSQWVTGFKTLVVFAFLLGIVISALNALCNFFVVKGTVVSSRAKYLSGLQMMYGLGSLTAPLVVKKVLEMGGSWQWCFWFILPPVIYVIFVLWKKISPDSPSKEQVKEAKEISVHSEVSGILLFLIISGFSIYVAGEVMASMWMVTYLVDAHHFKSTDAAPYSTLFFLMMGLSRGLCFLSIRPEWEKRVIVGCLVGAVFFNVLANQGCLWALPFIGILGPFFPLYLNWVSHHFPQSYQKLILWMLTSVQVTLTLLHLSVGKIADHIGMRTAYWLPTFLLSLTLVIVILSFSNSKNRVFAKEGCVTS